ncbi:MAG: AAA family ATPase [Pseudomonadota bacterium]|nr:AAA family ATPase [Pseudomonadota bacterium]
MKLKSVKLSGFKSFVDSTTVLFPSQITSIVGPNGCGKSNVIDAVRWVLGESSAKNLRSESMSDVVFNGSNSRKPVSRASVELIFDNKEGRIGGEFASYNEISVRRTLDLDGQSNYYLNGTSCRKRDITDLFLGTGLGPRSYAIIEQGMIERLVSSKPEEMRAYIEEVAGISRYLERRKETESRIKRTKENLSRLEDLREEIGRLLFKLKQQSKAAEKYSLLRKEEKHLKGLLSATQWAKVSELIKQKEQEIKDQEIKFEEINTVKTTSDSKIEEQRAKQIELQSAMDNVQQRFYSVGADISRVEQELDTYKEKLKDLKEKVSANKQTLESKENDLERLKEQEKGIDAEISSILPILDSLREKQLIDQSTLVDHQEIEKHWLDLKENLEISIEEIKRVATTLQTFDHKIPIDRAHPEIFSKLEEIKVNLESYSKKPAQLTSQMSSLLSESSQEKEERLSLLDKTKEFADLQARLATNASQQNHLSLQVKEITTLISSSEEEIFVLDDPQKKATKSLEILLEDRLKVERDLTKNRTLLEDCVEAISSIEKEKFKKEQLSLTLREELEKLRLELQALNIEATNIEKLVSENNQDLEKLVLELSEETTIEVLKEEIEVVERKISRLGAINLAAMEEYAQEEKRKLHLDAQNEELNNALETLEKAIYKIDKETRTTFKDSFDSLNSKLAEFFPKLFGGGHAELVLLGDDLLTSGVGIIAKPPGKKNTKIAQLSGGEKALSAIALVFAFFELNPAPFCMLDEVDAPLDDLNTMRFIGLIEEMSEKVQFIYVTHNKISMEKSKHLMGVTMQEPGVSRLVAVDVEEAFRLAAN